MRILRCHHCGSSHCCGAGLIPGPRNFIGHGWGQKNKQKKTRTKTGHLLVKTINSPSNSSNQRKQRLVDQCPPSTSVPMNAKYAKDVSLSFSFFLGGGGADLGTYGIQPHLLPIPQAGSLTTVPQWDLQKMFLSTSTIQEMTLG